MKELVQRSPVIMAHIREQEERKQKAQEEIKNKIQQDQRKFEENKVRIESKISQRPLLIEQEVEMNKKARIQAIKDLKNLQNIMRKAGIKDPNAYFTLDEIEKLEDAKYLENRGII